MPAESLETRIIQLDQPFNRVKISGTGRFTMVRGERALVRIVADRRIVDKPVVKVLGDKLYVYMDRDVHDLDKIFFEPSYEIVTTGIVAVDVSGEMVGILSGATGEKFQLALSGLTNVRAENLRMARADVELSGTSLLEASGIADLIVLDLSGSSIIKAMDLKASRGRVVVRGSAKANVFITEHLDADAGGVGRIVYRGHAHVVQKESGCGRVVADD